MRTLLINWEQVKLSELVTKEKSYSLSRDVETEKETETRYIHYGDIHTGIADKITKKKQLPFIKEDSYEPLLKGDLILADASEDYQGIATPAIILETTKYRIVAGLHTIVLRPSDKCDSLYLYYLLKTKSFKRHGYRMGTGMKVFGITANNVLAFKTLLPSKKEQNKISQLLKIMDRLLTLQQRKLDLLTKLKQGYLQQLFPSKDKYLPRLRFKEFNGDWKQVELDDISNKVTEKNKDLRFSETLTNSAEYGIINQREFFDKDISNEKNLSSYYVVRNNDFIYNPRISNYAPVGPIKRNKLGRPGVMSPLYYVFRTHDISELFLEYYFETTKWHKFMKLNGDSGARSDRFAIKDAVFSTMPIPYSSFKEQQKIGRFFQTIEQAITLQQSKINQLNKLKQSYLQKLFP